MAQVQAARRAVCAVKWSVYCPEYCIRFANLWWHRKLRIWLMVVVEGQVRPREQKSFEDDPRD